VRQRKLRVDGALDKRFASDADLIRAPSDTVGHTLPGYWDQFDCAFGSISVHIGKSVGNVSAAIHGRI